MIVSARGRAARGEGAEGRDRGGDPRRGRAPALMQEPSARGDRRTSAGRHPRALAENLGKVVHAPAETLRLCVLCLVGEGHLIIEDFPGVGKTMLAKALARSLDCSFSRLQFTPDLLPVRRHRRQRLQPALERVRVPAGPGLREPPPRRRDQPRLAEDAGGAARVHAGEPGDDRRRQLRARPAVHGHGDAEPDRVRGHVPAARGAARPLHDAARASATRRSPRRRGCSPSRRATRRSTTLEPVDERDRDRSTVIDEATRVFVEESLQPLRRRARSGRRASDPRLYLGASPRAGIALLRVAKARALADGRDYVLPDDVKAVAAAGARAPADPRRRRRAPPGSPAEAARPRGRRANPGPGLSVAGLTERGRLVARCSRAASTSSPGRSARGRSTRVAIGLVLAVDRREALGRGSSGSRSRCGARSGEGARSRATTSRSASRSQPQRHPGPRSIEVVEQIGAARRAPGAARARHGRPLRGRYVLAAVPRGRYRVRGGARGRSRTRSGSRAPSSRPRRASRRCSSTRGSSTLDRLFSRDRRARRRTAGGCSCGGRPASTSTACASTSRASRCARCTGGRPRGAAQLMVKELEDVPRDEIAVLLDADEQRGRRASRSTSQVRAAGSILRAHVARGRRVAADVDVRAAGDRASVASFDGDWRRALELLAAAEPTGTEPVARFLAATRRRPRRRVELVVVTARSTPRLVDALLERAFARRPAALVFVDAASFGRAARRRAREPGAPAAPGARASRSPSSGAATTSPRS